MIDNSCNTTNYAELQSLLSCTIEEVTSPEIECSNVNKDRTIFLLKAKKNFGFARANNIAYEYAKTVCEFDTVVFSNNDIQFPGIGNFTKLKESFYLHPDVGLVGPRIFGLNGKVQSPCKFVDITDRWIKLQLLWPLTKVFKSVKTHDVSPTGKSDYVYRIIGAFMVLTREAFERAGRFDEHTFLYCEEPILSERLNSAGYKVYYYNEVELIHEGGYTTGSAGAKFNTTKIKRQFESEFYYYAQYRKVSKSKLRLARFACEFYCLKLRLANMVIK